MGYYVRGKNNVRLFVEDIGKGKPVLMLHGWPINHKMYEYQLNILPSYGIRVIAPDLRGFGKSDRPFKGYSYRHMADDIKAIVDALGLQSFTLLGFSMGGAIAIKYMSRYMGYKVNKLILAGAAAPSFSQRTDYPFGMPVEDINRLINSLYQDRPKALDNFGKDFFATKVSDEFRGWFNQLGLEASGHGTIQTAKSLRDEDLRNDLQTIIRETYILHGKKDKICPYEFALEMRKRIMYSKLIPFEQSGHGLFYDEMEKFNRELLGII
ncbi:MULTISPECIES: alpha/beta fold hydrolase [unclassified Bacillus (in: firmicutes)]|uniref:alpha/beta fold hydrolase n=1 Tax=unclassified Bacillus (in: firmicutes) TaxID=185979 RepID=UPI0008F0679A|nr:MULTISPECIES: alpha/beta hydrolase [unclassified Bacillus (in: firmicutes)]SFB06449.1 Pimeloyl-ACP methyl ester carboxylesterase [Bacillus sp. UNCCL13]SFQ87666.1 Pimeloyl-ACP methyl ester carboxylesterase [Bacillus sp. cl95]